MTKNSNFPLISERHPAFFGHALCKHEVMIRKAAITVGLPVVFCTFIAIVGVSAKQESGEALFRKHCVACHPDISKLKGVKSIIDRMRNPLTFKPKFDETTISNEEAKEIENYISNYVRCSDKVTADSSKKPPSALGQ